jgi:hypothetical protein
LQSKLQSRPADGFLRPIGYIDRRDEEGNYPGWIPQVQIVTKARADASPFNPFDVTKVWPHAEFPPIEIGVLELNRDPNNDFAEVEQLACNPSHVVRAIESRRAKTTARQSPGLPASRLWRAAMKAAACS